MGGHNGKVAAHVDTGPMVTLKLDPASRKRASIPESAICYAFCYGRHSGKSTNHDAGEDCSARRSRRGETHNCTGFLFFDKDGVCASASIFTKYNLESAGQDINFLNFQPPKPVPTNMESSLSWRSVVWPEDARSWADRMVWILPDQIPGLTIGALGYRLRQQGHAICFPHGVYDTGVGIV